PGGNVDQTITVSGTPVRVNVNANTFKLFFTQVSVSFGDFLTLTGDFTVQSGTGALTGATLYGANNVELFIGDGPYRLEDGSVNNDAIGLLVTQGKLGVVDFGEGVFALYAEGRAQLVGFGTFVELDAPVTVRINKTGRAINVTIQTNAAGTQSIAVNFTSSQFIEKFTVGVPAVGSTPAVPAEIVFGRVVSIKGVLEFTITPGGRVDVNIPVAEVGIKIPFNGVLTEAFSIRGAAHFSFGGGMGFQLQDIRVSGFSIFSVGADIGNPATALRPPTADLGSPHAGATVASIDFLSGTSGTIEVVYNTLNPGAIIDASTITDDAPEFTFSGPAFGLIVNGRAVQVDPTDPRRFRYSFTGTLNQLGGTTVDVAFLAGSFSDSSGAASAVSLQTFYVTFPSTTPGPPKPTAVLVSPTGGSVVNASVLAARGYLDVKFINGTPDGCTAPGTEQPAACTINGDEFVLTSPTAATTLRIASTFKVQRISETIWRYNLEPATGVAVTNMFGAGVVDVAFAANRWTVGSVNNVASKTTFTIATDVQTGGTATNPISLGPLRLEGPSVSLADVKLDGTKLILTVAVGVNSASLSFGSGGSGGMSASLTGILGKFFVEVDLAAALTAVTSGNFSALLAAFNVPGRFSLDVATVRVEVPGIVIATGAGIKVNWDSNALPSQELLTVRTATVTFPTFGVTAQISPFITGPGPTASPDDDTFIPGLTVRGNGFKLGTADLIIRPTSGQPIDLLGLLLFDDLRVGVSNFGVTFGTGGPTLDDGSGITFGSGGVRFLPGKPVNGQITDGTDADTNAITATVRFAGGAFQSLELEVDTLTINLASVLTLKAQGFKLNTGAGPTEELVSFTSISASLNLGSIAITGEARSFAFLGNGSFRAKSGFGIFLSANGAGGSGFGWMDWLPVRINSIGITWPDIEANPADFVLILSASVTEITAIPNLEFSGAIEGIQIDVGKLLRGEFPIIGIGAFGVSVKGDLFGGKIEAELLGGLLKLDAGGQIISDLDTVTPVAQRVFYAGLAGGFSFSGIGGFTIRLGLSELGPLSVALSVSLPTGILIYPPFGLTINDFYASVEFFKSLPSIDEPEQLRGGEFQPPNKITPEQWLTSLKSQVAAQARLLKQNPGMSGFAAAFTAPMLITGSARIYTIYTSKALFNGQVVIKFSTDGKFLIAGFLNFFDDNLTISGKLYADLSRIASGNATVLFLADIPDQVRFLTIQGKLKMGFRDASGQQVEFAVPQEPAANPIGGLAGPSAGGTVSLGDLNGRGYVDYTYSPGAGNTLDTASINGDEFTISAPSTLAIDTTQGPVLISGSTYRYWTRGTYTSGAITLNFVADKWAWFDSAGEHQANVASTATVTVPATAGHHYVDVKLVPQGATNTVDADTVNGDELSLSGG
ncbi:MAG: hypothetical protein ABI717_06790, partial [Actinomycetota bacterium]